jgi:hypothetical protein
MDSQSDSADEDGLSALISDAESDDNDRTDAYHESSRNALAVFVPPEEPERFILHLDMDCFYCQVESIRLGIPSTTPMAVQQWQGLIAVNYPARAAGVQRHCRVDEALKLCPDLVLVHVATYKLGTPTNATSI